MKIPYAVIVFVKMQVIPLDFNELHDLNDKVIQYHFQFF